jgi:hypothetical protein
MSVVPQRVEKVWDGGGADFEMVVAVPMNARESALLRLDIFEANLARVVLTC